MYKKEKEYYEKKEEPQYCFNSERDPACKYSYGHYDNMIVNPKVKKVACGIYVTPQGKYKAVMNFFS